MSPLGNASTNSPLKRTAIALWNLIIPFIYNDTDSKDKNMPQKTYNVICNGEVVPGIELEEAKRRLTEIFNTAPDSAGRLLSGKAVVVKKNVSRESAIRYANGLKKAGVLCRIREAENASAWASVIPETLKIIEGKASIRDTPLFCHKITPWEKGIRLNRKDLDHVPYRDIKMISVFKTVRNILHIVFFIEGIPRPFEGHLSCIQFTGFPFIKTPKALVSLKSFIFFIHKNNPDLFIDEHTRRFTDTAIPFKLEKAKVDYYSNLVKTLEVKECMGNSPTKHLKQDKGPTPPLAVAPRPPSVKMETAPLAVAPRPASEKMEMPPLKVDSRHNRQVAAAPLTAPRAAAPSIVPTEASSPPQNSSKAPLPELTCDPLTFRDLATDHATAGILFAFLIGLKYSPAIIINSYMSNIRINNRALRFKDDAFSLKLCGALLPTICFLLIGLFFDLGIIQWNLDVDALVFLFLITAGINICFAGIVVMQSLLSNTATEDGAAFTPLYGKDCELKDMASFIKGKPGDVVYLGLFFLFSICLMTLPLGFALQMQYMFKHLRVGKKQYKVNIPWIITLLWCFGSYITLGLLSLKYISTLVNEYIPRGKWLPTPADFQKKAGKAGVGPSQQADLKPKSRGRTEPTSRFI